MSFKGLDAWILIPSNPEFQPKLTQVTNFTCVVTNDEDSNNDLTIDDPWFEPTQFELPLDWATKRHRCIKGGTPIDGYWICKDCGRDMEKVI